MFTSLMTVAPLWTSIDLGRITTPVASGRERDDDRDPTDDHSVEEIFEQR